MLKIKTFILALSLFPILSLTWQLPSQAQSNSPSKGAAGSGSGAGPSKGAAGSLSGGATSGRPLSLSPNVRILTTGLLIISQPIQIILNQAGRNTLLNFPGGNSSIIVLILKGIPNGNLQLIAARFINIGAPPGRVESLMRALFGLYGSRRQASVPALPVAQLPQEQLVSSTKALKAKFTISQAADTQPSENLTPIPDTEANTEVDVDINQLNDAISAYNDIIRESSPVALQQLAQNEEFLAIGKALKELRAAIN
ncbi:hypothetical protein FJR11_05265 [Anabaena sp. UHCC 0187]|uniref:hypothetical protein n=1 Tax=Anabaena sp. UHCC 0187 TaxID=2590018 RepID=UPI001447C662|nr:hypothetical protein [Anabaena sp. UHCC 0187]MDP5016690.1 hypothetical protein [Dolichospermum sp.]MTJ12014.1 hypothetical protein [Anabaena sp. UHCC 0187]